MKRVAIITSSDTGYRGEREDLSGPAIREIVRVHDGSITVQSGSSGGTVFDVVFTQ